MAMPNTVEVCKVDLFTDKDKLVAKYDECTVARILRLRDLYLYKLGSPDSPDRRFIDEAMGRYGISQRSAYSDLAIVKQLLPMLSSASRAFHLWRANEMTLEAYNRAKVKGDLKAMVSAAKQYADNNQVSKLDEQPIPYDEIVPQPFTATDDPRVLGIEPMPNINEKIKSMIAKYRAETIDIEDVEAEDVDLEEKDIFGDEE